MALADSDNSLYYLSGHFPLKSTVTVRMQSEAWAGAITEARNKPFGEVVATLEDLATDIQSAAADAIA